MADDYRFIDKHPIVDILRTAIFDDKRSIQAIAMATHGQITPATIRKWLYGETKRPQYYKITAVLEAVGVVTEHRWRSTGQLVDINPALAKHYADIHKANIAARLGVRQPAQPATPRSPTKAKAGGAKQPAPAPKPGKAKAGAKKSSWTPRDIIGPVGGHA